MIIYLIRCIVFILIVIPTLTGCGGGSGGGGSTTSSTSGSTVSPSSTPVLSIESTYNTYGQARGVLKNGDYVYVADGTTGLVVLRVNSNNSFTSITSISMQDGGHAYSFAKSGNYLYMAAREEGIYVLDISTTSSPSLVTIVSTIDYGNASFLTVDGNNLFVSAGNYLVIYNISAPSAPSMTGSIEGTSPTQHLVVEDNKAYVAAYNKGFRIIDVSDTSSPVLLSETNPGYSIRSIIKHGDYVYIGGSNSGLKVYNVSNPSLPSLTTTLSLPDEDTQSPYDMVKWGNFIFIADGESGIQVVDITTPSSPALSDTIDTSGTCWGLFVDDLKLIAADYSSGVHQLNIFETTDIDGDGVVDGNDAFKSDPDEWLDTDGDGTGNNADLDDDSDGVLDVNDNFPLDSTEWTDSDGDGVGDNSDIFIYDSTEWADADMDGIGDNTDTENLPTFTAISYYDSPSGQSRDTLKDGNIIYVADGTAGLLVLQIASDGTLTPIGSYSLSGGGSIRSLAKTGNYLYMACRSEGLLVLDVSNPASPSLVYTYDTPDMASFITIDGSTLYLSDRNSLQIFNISVPQLPVWQSELAAYSEFEHVVVENDIAYIAGYYHGVFMVDVSDPASPEIMENTGGIGFGLWAIEKHGNYVFTGGEGSGLKVYDVEDPYNPSLVTSLDLPSSADTATSLDQPPFHMEVHGSYLYIADGDYGIQTIDVSNPESPFLKTDFDTPGYTWEFSIDGYTIIVGDYNNGVHLVNLGTNLDHDGDGTPNYLE